MSGTSPDERLVEIVELPDHPFYVASQFHPEFKSRPERPAPLFREFVGAALVALGAAQPRRAGTQRGVSAPASAERRRLHDTFAALCRDREPVGQERALRRRRRRRELRGARARGRRGRRRRRARRRLRQPARADPRDRRAARCCSARTSTPCRSRRRSSRSSRDGVWENANEAILGADNKAAVAAMLTLARAPRRGARARPASSCSSPSARRSGCAARRSSRSASCAARVGYTFDSAAPVGGVVVASPTYYRIDRRAPRASPPTPACAPRRAAARSSPPRARSREMRLGRIDEETTANIGTIEGGSAANVVPDRCRLVGEARSLDAARAEQLASEIVELPRRRRQRSRMRVRPRRHARAPVRRLPRAPVERPRWRSPSRALRDCGLRAGADRHRRRQRRQRAARQRSRRAEPRKRHRAQPRAGRARQHRGARGDPRRRVRAGRASARAEATLGARAGRRQRAATRRSMPSSRSRSRCDGGASLRQSPARTLSAALAPGDPRLRPSPTPLSCASLGRPDREAAHDARRRTRSR